MTIWLDMLTAPRDGTLVDLVFDGIRRVDCSFQQAHNAWGREHGYPSSRQVFLVQPDGWMPRPEGLVKPYEYSAGGRQYVP